MFSLAYPLQLNRIAADEVIFIPPWSFVGDEGHFPRTVQLKWCPQIDRELYIAIVRVKSDVLIIREM